MDLVSFGAGFVAGGLLVGLAVAVVFTGRVKSVAIGKEGFKIEGNPDFRPDVPDVEVGQEVEVGCSGRWLTRADKPGEKFGGHGEGVPTPAKVRLMPGEVYRFRADFGMSDSDLRKLAELSKHPQFRSLTLYSCRHITEAGLCQLQAFKHLWELDLASTNATDKVLAALHGLTSLKSLTLKGCRVSHAALNQLRQALPNCRVSAAPGTSSAGG